MGIAVLFWREFFSEIFFLYLPKLSKMRLREKIDGSRLLSSLSPNAAIFIRIE